MQGKVRRVWTSLGSSIMEIEVPTEYIDKYIDKTVDISVSRNKRSLDANACLWACLGDIASAIRSDPWDVYLYMLQRYGKYEYILAKPEAVEDLRKQWREIKVVGDRQVWKDGEPQNMIELLCFYGSSTYNTKEFSRLLDGVISEMKEMQLETPDDERIESLMDEWGKEHERRTPKRESK